MILCSCFLYCVLPQHLSSENAALLINRDAEPRDRGVDRIILFPRAEVATFSNPIFVFFLSIAYFGALLLLFLLPAEKQTTSSVLSNNQNHIITTKLLFKEKSERT